MASPLLTTGAAEVSPATSARRSLSTAPLKVITTSNSGDASDSAACSARIDSKTASSDLFVVEGFITQLFSSFWSRWRALSTTTSMPHKGVGDTFVVGSCSVARA
eukprot:1715429-Karenia_brevis.AAC.1